MAKRGSSINKSDRVRNYLADYPDAGPKAVAEALAKHGVTAALVSNVKFQMKKSGNGLTDMAGSNTILAAARLIKICGGVRQANEAVVSAAKVAEMLKEAEE